MAIINNSTTKQKHNSLIPRDLLKQVLSHAPLRVQRVLMPTQEHTLAVRWKYGEYDVRIICIADNQKLIKCGDRFDYLLTNTNCKSLIFTRNHIYTDDKAFCAYSGKLLQSIEGDLHITALDYTIKGFITGWKDGGVHFPGCKSHYTSEITTVYIFEKRVFIGSEDGQCDEWSPTGEFVSSFPKGTASVTSISCNQGIMVISYADCTIRLFIDNQLIATKTAEFIAFTTCIFDKTIFTGHEDGKIRIWSADDLRFVKSIQSGGVTSAIHVCEELLVVGLVSGRIELFNWQIGEVVCQFTDHKKMVTRVMIHEESIISSSLDGTIWSRSLC